MIGLMLLLQTTLTIAVAGPATSPEYLALRVAEAEGYFTDERLRVTLHSVRAESAAAEALARGAISAASVAHVLDHRRRAGRQPPLLDLVLPADPRVRDLRVTPHALSAYDALLTPPPAANEETPDDPAC